MTLLEYKAILDVKNRYYSNLTLLVKKHMPNIDHYCKTVLQYIFILRLPRMYRLLRCFNTRFHNTMSPGIETERQFRHKTSAFSSRWYTHTQIYG
jgi:hypothetical protein